jgi:hypothetical protein
MGYAKSWRAESRQAAAKTAFLTARGTAIQRKNVFGSRQLFSRQPRREAQRDC